MSSIVQVNWLYSGSAIIFFMTLLAVYSALWLIELRFYTNSLFLEKIIYFIFSVALIVFAAMRPIGISLDDANYLVLYDNIRPISNYSDFVQGRRDYFWYFLLAVLKSIVADPKVMLWLAAASLTVKLAVFYKVSKRPLPVLFIYAALFYELHDLTQLRVSLAIAFFLAAIFFIIYYRCWWFSILLVFCGVFHKQAFVAPFVLVGKFLTTHRVFFLFVSAILVCFVAFGFYPDLVNILHGSGELIWYGSMNNGLELYAKIKQEGGYRAWNNAPIVVYPQIIFTMWLLFKTKSLNKYFDSVMSGCFFTACCLLWGFASLPEAQVRFFDFFMVPTVLLVGVRRLSFFEFLGLIVVSGLYILKYNVFHHLLA